jgi:alanine racemase
MDSVIKEFLSLYNAGCRHFWVAYLKEAIDIRESLSFDAKIYFLQGFFSSAIGLIKAYKATPVRFQNILK